MEEVINDLLITLNNYSVFGYPLDTLMPYILGLVGGLCILADYLFDTDVPAHQFQDLSTGRCVCCLFRWIRWDFPFGMCRHVHSNVMQPPL